ncbi:hypothetical protein NPIL_500181 [Nephila pilipes]|uniref:Uncharacterized protein n=1 Tax=Nephila pilipes TaxID=299642 RepID=A0A8X6U2V9_NEPPI|nr:hypothetical protein NPIL_500181 [Nephila pilipes]
MNTYLQNLEPTQTIQKKLHVTNVNDRATIPNPLVSSRIVMRRRQSDTELSDVCSSGEYRQQHFIPVRFLPEAWERGT